MRGIPNHPVPCKSCSLSKGCIKDSLCHRCRLLARPNRHKRFVWTADLETRLTRIYQESKTREDLTAGLNHLQRFSGFSRIVITSRAGSLGLNHVRRRGWTSREIDFVQEHVGILSVSAIARRLQRSHYSVKAKVASLRLSLRVREGYSVEDIRTLLGVKVQRIHAWLEKDWLRVENRRVTEASVREFLISHPEEYKLNRVDEAWYKGLLFPRFGCSQTFRNELEGKSRSYSDRPL